MQMTERKQFVAEPVDEKDKTSPWITGKPKAIKAVKKILGQSDYVAHEGVNSGGANGVYWVDIIEERPDGLVVVGNITKGAKVKVESIQVAIEPDLIYPLLRGGDVKRWQAEPSSYILVTHLPAMKLKAIHEDEMKTDYPKTYLYLKRFEAVLRKRAAYKRYFRSDAPFYSMFDVGEYTFAPYKVVWTRIGSIGAAVVSSLDGKPIIPQETITLVACKTIEEAHYIAGLINSASFQYAVTSYSQAGGKSMGSPHVLQNIRIPKYDSLNEIHQELTVCSQSAHIAKDEGDEASITAIQQHIDELAAQLWGLTKEELEEIQESLNELK